MSENFFPEKLVLDFLTKRLLNKLNLKQCRWAGKTIHSLVSSIFILSEFVQNCSEISVGWVD